MGFTLNPKHEVFTVMDGLFAGHTYRHGQVYDEVPPQEAHKFDSEGAKDDSPLPKGKKKNPLTLEPLDSGTNDLKGGE